MKTIDKFQSLNYEIVLPREYEQNLTQSWPLIVFLHGIQRRGNDITMINIYGLNGIAKASEHFEFILLTPQCPSGSTWVDQTDAILALIDEVSEHFNIDRQRIYLTGFSLGGNGTWEIAAHSPSTFAAIAPIAGWCNLDLAIHLKNMPIWNFHGEDDDIVSIKASEDIINELKNINNLVKFTKYPSAKHGVMNETYSNPELFKWFLLHGGREDE